RDHTTPTTCNELTTTSRTTKLSSRRGGRDVKPCNAVMPRRSAAAPGSLPCRGPAPQCQELGAGPPILPPALRGRASVRFWCPQPAPLARWFDGAGERFSAHSFGDHRLPPDPRPRWIPLGRLMPVPTPPPDGPRPQVPVPLVWRLPCPSARPKRPPPAPR